MTRALIAFVLVVLLGLPATVHAAPRLVALPTKGSIEMHYEPGLESTARKMRDSAEETLERISNDLVDLPVPKHIKVQLVTDAAQLPAIAPAGRGAPPWAIGVAYPDLGVISVAIRRGAQISDPVQTLRHELAHIALGTAIGPRAPHWLHEGFAYQHSNEWSWDRTETLAGMAWFGGLIPLGQLDASFPQEENPANRAYAQSYDFVGYLSRRGRWEDKDDDGDRWPFRRFLTAVGQGSTLDAAAMRAFGKPIGELFDEWRDDLSKRYLLAPIGLFGLALWILCAFLLALAWFRKRRINRRRLGQWEIEEREASERAAAASERLRPVVVAPPAYVPWPGEDPFAEDDERPSPSDPPKLVN
jgi:hypothetical protein